MMELIPGICETEWDAIETKVKLVSPYVDWVQIDFADQTLVNLATNMDFEAFARLIQEISHHNGISSPSAKKRLSFEAHLMVANPEKYIHKLVDAGFQRLIAHVEAVDPRLFLDAAKYESVEVGLAVDGGSELEVLEPYGQEIDVALIMLSDFGRIDQEIQAENVEKIRLLREGYTDLPIAVESGMNEQSIQIVSESGANRAILTSYLFENGSVSEKLERLKKIIHQ